MTTPQPIAAGDPSQLPDSIRVPLHRLWADAGYLVARAVQGDSELAVHTIKALCDEVERAVRADLTPAPAQPEPQTAGVEPVAWTSTLALEMLEQGQPVMVFARANDSETEPIYTSPPTLSDAQCDAIQNALERALARKDQTYLTLFEGRAIIRAVAGGGT